MIIQYTPRWRFVEIHGKAFPRSRFICLVCLIMRDNILPYSIIYIRNMATTNPSDPSISTNQGRRCMSVCEPLSILHRNYRLFCRVIFRSGSRVFFPNCECNICGSFTQTSIGYESLGISWTSNILALADRVVIIMSDNTAKNPDEIDYLAMIIAHDRVKYQMIRW